MIPSRVTLVEVGPRDGLQNEKEPVGTDDKVELVHRLQAAGLREIEVTSFVSPKWVPQMADNAQVMAASVRETGVRYSVLTPNMKGFEAALPSQTRRDRGVRRRHRGLQPAQHQLLDRREHRALRAGGGGRARSRHQGARRGLVRARLPLPGRGDARRGGARGAAAQGHRRATCAASPTPSAWARRARCRRRWQRALEHYALARRQRPFPRHLRPGAGRTSTPAWRSACTRSMPASPASAAARTPRAPPATWPPKTWCSCCDGLGIETGIDLDALVDAGAFISGRLGRPAGVARRPRVAGQTRQGVRLTPEASAPRRLPARRPSARAARATRTRRCGWRSPRARRRRRPTRWASRSGQIAKSVIFRRRSDDRAVLVITSGDRRVDEAKVGAVTGALGRADAGFVKASTGFSIGGVAPLAHADAAGDADRPRAVPLRRDLGRGRPPQRRVQADTGRARALTGAPVADVVDGDVSARGSRRCAASRVGGCAVAVHQRLPHGRRHAAGAKAACARSTRSSPGAAWPTTTSARCGSCSSSGAVVDERGSETFRGGPMKHIIFWFDLISPFAYLAFEHLPQALEGCSYEVAVPAGAVRRTAQPLGAERTGRDRAQARLDLPPRRVAVAHAWASRSRRRPRIRSIRCALLRLALGLRRRWWHAEPACRRDPVAPRLARRRRCGRCRRGWRAALAHWRRDATRPATTLRANCARYTDDGSRARRVRRADLRAGWRLFWGVDALPMLRAALQGDAWFDGSAVGHGGGGTAGHHALSALGADRRSHQPCAASAHTIQHNHADHSVWLT